jgi:hypothetical protein
MLKGVVSKIYLLNHKHIYMDIRQLTTNITSTHGCGTKICAKSITHCIIRLPLFVMSNKQIVRKFD